MLFLGNIFIKDKHVILQDVDCPEVSLTIDDALDVQAWLFDHNPELQALLHQPPEPMFNARRALNRTQEQEGREQYL